MFEKKSILLSAVGPYKTYCDGYGNRGASGSGYIVGTVLSVAKVKRKFYHLGSNILDSINAFDKAEVADTNIGQINMITVSSFCGPMGLVLGYDILPSGNLNIYKMRSISSSTSAIYKIDPLLDATRKLLGTKRKRGFSFIPGAHVPCAGRNIEKGGPCRLYSALAVGIATDREKHANVLMEDVGLMQHRERVAQEHLILSNLAKSVEAIAVNQRIEYKKIFVGIKYIDIADNEIGCALVRAPYIVLAKNAIKKLGLI